MSSASAKRSRVQAFSRRDGGKLSALGRRSSAWISRWVPRRRDGCRSQRDDRVGDRLPLSKPASAARAGRRALPAHASQGESNMAEQVLAMVRTGPSQTGTARIPDAGHRRGRRAAEDGGRRHLRHRRQALQDAAEQRADHHGPREHRLHRQGRPRIHPPQGLQGRRPGLRRALCDVRQVRVVPSGPVPPLREHRLAQQSRRHPLRLHLGREARRICGAASRNMSTCRGTPWCTTCRRA